MVDQKHETQLVVKGKKLFFGLLLVLFSTIVSTKYFNAYSASLNRQVFGVFICVVAFVSGIILIFSSVPRKSWWNYIMTPIVVVLGVIFVMNYLYYSGVATIIDEYPVLRAEYDKNKYAVQALLDKMLVLENQNDNLNVLLHLKNAETLMKNEGKFHEAAAELQQVKAIMAGTQFQGLQAVELLIADLEKIPDDLHTRLLWLSIDIERVINEQQSKSLPNPQ